MHRHSRLNTITGFRSLAPRLRHGRLVVRHESIAHIMLHITPSSSRIWVSPPLSSRFHQRTCLRL